MRAGEATTARVCRALRKAGYSSEGIAAARFSGMTTTGSEIHVVTYRGDGLVAGRIFIDKDGNAEY